MPASVIPITARRRGAYLLVQAALPGHAPQTIGVLLLDPDSDRLWLRMRQSYDDLMDPEDTEVFEALEEHIRARAAELGAEAYLASLEDSLSNALRVSERQAVAVDSFTRVLDRLYAEQVEPVEVKPYVTHVPLYTLRAAAGKLGEEMEAAEEDWVRAPEGMRLDPNLFAAHVVGRSMEPRIPDGSLNLFRFHPVGSRQGKIVLVERYGAFEETARFTVKRYTSQKVQTGEEEWRHERIRLEPLNPEFEAWEAGPQDFAVVAEWLRVLE
jgi:phage repressor protein C with HTH and peptisase S24 domain